MLLRNAFLSLSQNSRVRQWVEDSRLARPLTARFIAGRTFEDGLEAARQLRSAGMLAALDRLGENVTTVEEAAAATEAYLTALDRLAHTGFETTISGKLTQFGLDLSEDLCLKNTIAIAARACQTRSRFEIDMEDSRYTQRTIDIVRKLQASSGCMRAVIQAYLYRSRADIELLNSERIPIRLCKGAYNEPKSVAYPRKADVDENFITLLRLLLEHGTYPAIATHDPRMLDATKAFVRERGLSRDRFEFQMLFGIRRDLQRQLVEEGYRLRVYVPYGEAWYPYFMRRIAERPANLVFVMRNLLRS